MILRFVLASLLALCSFSSFAKPSIDWTNQYQKYVKSIALIHIRNAGVCAGGLISKRLVITAAHCVTDMRDVEISWNGSKKRTHVGSVVYRNFKKDVAVLKLDKDKEGPVFKLRTDYSNLKVGDNIATIGHPASVLASPLVYFEIQLLEDLTYVFSQGTIARMGPEMIIGDISINPGNSGGPVFLPNGEVVGVVSGYAKAGKVGTNTSIIWRFDKIDELKDLKKLEKAPKVSWLAASSDFHLSLFYTEDPFLEDNYDGSARDVYIGLGVDFKDRLRLQYSFNYSTDVYIKKYDVGWKFYKWNMKYVPFVSFTDYTGEHNDKLRVRGGLSLELDAAGLFLRYEAPHHLLTAGYRF